MYKKSQDNKLANNKQGSLIENVQSTDVNIDTSNIVKEEFYSEENGKKVYGYFTAPKNYKENKLPTIIYSHGFGGRAEFGDYMAKNLASKGYIVYSFDFVGGNPNSRSGNDTLSMSVFTEQDDLNVVLNAVKVQNFVDNNNIFLLGASQGGVVSTMVAAEHKDSVKGLILIFPAFVLFDDARDLFKTADEIPEVYNHRGNNVGKVYFEKSLDYDIYNTMKNYSGNVLIIHGTNDNIVPISYSERAINTFSSAELKAIPGAGHGFSNSQYDETLTFINDYLQKNIK